MVTAMGYGICTQKYTSSILVTTQHGESNTTTHMTNGQALSANVNDPSNGHAHG